MAVLGPGISRLPGCHNEETWQRTEAAFSPEPRARMTRRIRSHPPPGTSRRPDVKSGGETRTTAPQDVMAAAYDSPDRGSPPRGVAKVAVERMDRTGVELLARDLLELLVWARSEEESNDG